MPVLGPGPALLSSGLMRRYNRRLAPGPARRPPARPGDATHGRRFSAYFNLGLAPLRMALRGLGLWGRAELDGLRLALRARRVGAPRPSPAPAAAGPTPGPVSPSPAGEPTEALAADRSYTASP